MKRVKIINISKYPVIVTVGNSSELKNEKHIPAGGSIISDIENKFLSKILTNKNIKIVEI